MYMFRWYEVKTRLHIILSVISLQEAFAHSDARANAQPYEKKKNFQLYTKLFSFRKLLKKFSLPYFFSYYCEFFIILFSSFRAYEEKTLELRLL